MGFYDNLSGKGYTRDVEVSNPEGVSATNGSSPLAVVASAVPYHGSLLRVLREKA